MGPEEVELIINLAIKLGLDEEEGAPKEALYRRILERVEGLLALERSVDRLRGSPDGRG